MLGVALVEPSLVSCAGGRGGHVWLGVSRTLAGGREGQLVQ